MGHINSHLVATNCSVHECQLSGLYDNLHNNYFTYFQSLLVIINTLKYL